MNRLTVKSVRAVAVLALGTLPVARASAAEPSWHSPSLTETTVTGPNGVVTTAVALGANAQMGVP